ncbi:hypothetical protein [Enterococcus villorum]|uniref:hypothetical protein n=1 Tax=Enterococcus villorum TaxID=112904 RepID=UPI0011780095|nr:hypothetical protein [Enterococcus villorum]
MILGNKNRYNVNGLEKNFTSSDRFENVNEYAVGIIEALFKNEEKIHDKQSWKEFCQNFSDYISEESKRKLSMWNDFQKVSRDFKELHFERLVKREDLLENLTLREKEKEIDSYTDHEELTKESIELFTNKLNKKIGMLAMEVAKRNQDINILFYYDPKMSIARKAVLKSDDVYDEITNVRDLLDDPKQQLLEQELSYTKMFSNENGGKKKKFVLFVSQWGSVKR